VTIEDAEIATAEAELLPGKFTPPPAVIAKFCAVRIAPFVAFTDPGVKSLRLVTFAELNVVLPAIVMSPDVLLPN
jgi:hypothetical protein